MADNEYNQSAEILKAAIPYVNIRTKSTMNFISKLLEFIGSYQVFSRKDALTACGYEDDKIDFEGLLSAIRPHCNKDDMALIDKILSMFHAKRMFETYNTYMEAMKMMQGFTGNSSESSSSANENEDTFHYSDQEAAEAPNEDLNSLDEASEDYHNSDDADSTYTEFFNGFPTASNINNDSNDNSENDNREGFYTSFDNQTFSQNSEESLKRTLFDTPGAEYDFANNDSGNDYSKNNASNRNHEESIGAEPKSSQNNTSGQGNSSQMLDMLKTMVPADKLETLETLSMLFGSMSYDNNKPEHS